MKSFELNEDQALVLQQIEENDKEDFNNLAESLHFGHGYLMHIIQNLKHKGLIVVHGSWLSLSTKGKKITKLVWPELPYMRY
jgi:predicted transcriptional regulator